MKNFRREFDLFCLRNRSKGIPNLMLYISIGSAIVYFMTIMANNTVLYDLLCFSRSKILQGQVWRLFSFVLTYSGQNPILTAVILLCYYSLGRSIENHWGTLRFNLFYLSGILLMDIYCMIFPCEADVLYLNMSLFLAYATLYPDAHFLLFFIIPVKAWIFAILDLGLTLYNVISMLTVILTNPAIPTGFLPIAFFPLVAIANYFLFFGKGVVNVIPLSWRINARRLFRKNNRAKNIEPTVIPFSNRSSSPAPKATYLHRCTVCGRTDVSNPELEFRYCSRCNGYYCYCEDHIANHTHIQ